MQPQTHQKVNCTVKSCAYHEKDDVCSLKQIEVAACQNGGTGKPADESMCASYETR